MTGKIQLIIEEKEIPQNMLEQSNKSNIEKTLKTFEGEIEQKPPIYSAIKVKGKKVIAAARLKEYGEHVNDHQLQILENFSKKGYLVALEDFDKLDEAIKQAKELEPKPIKSNKQYFIKQLEKEINILG